jgi:hypothetical protein
MPLLCYLINSLCCALYRKDHRRFARLPDVKKAQEEKLFSILAKNKGTEYGRKYGFSDIKSVEDFRRSVPLTVYEDYAESIEKIADGENNILTAEDVRMLELSSGSTSASKRIPYTLGLREDFQWGLRPWLYDLYTNQPGIKSGKSYWSVTPVTGQNRVSKGGIPIGFDDDSQYFGKLEAKLFDLIFAVGKDVANSKDMDEFYRRTAVALLSCKHLSLISVWNPTYLLLILDYMRENAQALLPMIPSGRRKEIRDSLALGDFQGVWPRLRLISCWADANARPYTEKLKILFPGVVIQPKGLLATEGFISFPVIAAGGSVLSVFSHYFEFISLDDEHIYGAHEVKAGQQYEAVITTSGGLYRYRLNDVVEVTGFFGKIPTLRFVGKKELVSDLFGEKLNSIFVQNTLERLNIRAEFCMVAPAVDRYVLFVKSDEPIENPDMAFRENFHYDYCRKLGQLKEMRIFRLTGNPDREYLDECVRRGQKLGDIKPPALSLSGGWEDIFRGEFE